MRKVLSFSAFLIIGLLLSQYLPLLAGEGYATVKIVSNILLYICLSFIMINVGREFEVDKTRWRSYAGSYFTTGKHTDRKRQAFAELPIPVKEHRKQLTDI